MRGSASRLRNASVDMDQLEWNRLMMKAGYGDPEAIKRIQRITEQRRQQEMLAAPAPAPVSPPPPQPASPPMDDSAAESADPFIYREHCERMRAFIASASSLEAIQLALKENGEQLRRGHVLLQRRRLALEACNAEVTRLMGERKPLLG